MKNTGILNQPVSNLIAGLGHLDSIVIGDAGLPIPPGVRRIDLAVTRGTPGFLAVLDAVLLELNVEKAVVASETRVKSPEIFQGIRARLKDCPIQEVSHEQLKSMTRGAVAVIRTGECTPFANVLLVSGVTF